MYIFSPHAGYGSIIMVGSRAENYNSAAKNDKHRHMLYYAAVLLADLVLFKNYKTCMRFPIDVYS